MKTSLLVLAAIATFSLSSLSSYAKEEMAMLTSAAKTTAQKDIAGKGIVVAENKAGGSLTLSHEAIPAIGWGAMTMDFKVNDKKLLEKVKKGDKVQFTLVPQGQDYIITSIK